MSDGQASLNEIQQALSERWQEDLACVMALYGGAASWHDECRMRRRADRDYVLARIILRLLRGGSDSRRKNRNPVSDMGLSEDRAVATYWMSVAKAGDDGWQEERARIREVERAASASSDHKKRLLVLDVWAIRSLMPLYRTWGQMLCDAETDFENNQF